MSERLHVEVQFLQQLRDLEWTVIDQGEGVPGAPWVDSDHRILLRTFCMLGRSSGTSRIEDRLIVCGHADEEYRLSQLSRDTMPPNVTFPETTIIA